MQPRDCREQQRRNLRTGKLQRPSPEAAQQAPKLFPRPTQNQTPRDLITKWKIGYVVLGIGLFLFVGFFVAVRNWYTGDTANERNARSEANNIAVYQRMNIPLKDCYRWIIQFDDRKQVLMNRGMTQSSAEAAAIDDVKRGYTFGEYRALLQRCAVLWEQATELEKIQAMRESGAP